MLFRSGTIKVDNFCLFVMVSEIRIGSSRGLTF